MKKPALSGLLFTSLTLAASAPQAQYLSAVEMAVQEDNASLLRRSQRLVADQFAQVFEAWPELKGKQYEIRTNGNQILFSMTSQEDMRVPMQQAMANMIGNLNGRVRARGRSMFYKTAMEKQIGGYLEVTVDDTHSKILSISAQSVPLRDLLKEIKTQVGSISYLIPGECAEQLVDWSFGEMGDSEPKNIDVALGELATLFSLKLEKKSGTYIFSGTCNELKRQKAHIPSELLRNTLLPSSVQSFGQNGARIQQVFVPVFPFGD